LGDTWLTAKILLETWNDKTEVVRSLIAPLVQEFEKEPWFKSFHFMSYGNGEIYLRFRVKLDEEKKMLFQESIEKKRQYVNSERPLITTIDYGEKFVEDSEVLEQEQERFGKTGLNVFLNYFEYVSRTVIGLLERPSTEMEAYPVTYRMTLELFHFLLNTLLCRSFDGDGEISAHIAAIQERYLTIVHLLMDQGLPRDSAIERVLGSRPFIDAERTFKLTVTLERVQAR